MIIKILMLYAALMIATYIHELGHMPRKIVFKKWHGIPLPLASAMSAKFRYGGLMATAALFLAVYFYNPQILILQLIGAVAFLHFVLYTFFGSFNHEPFVPKRLLKTHVFDDIENKYWWFFMPLSLAVLLLFKDYYLQIIVRFFTG